MSFFHLNKTKVLFSTKSEKIFFHELENSIPLSYEEEKELIKSIHSKDKEVSDIAINKLITSNLRFVVKVADTYYKKIHSENIQLNDLIQEANIGLLQSINDIVNKKIELKGRFISYSIYNMRHNIIKYLNNMLNVKYVDLDLENIDRIMITSKIKNLNIKRIVNHLSINDNIGGYITMEELKIGLNNLRFRDKDVISLHLGIDTEPMSLEDIGYMFRLNKERIRQIYKRGIKDLTNFIKMKYLNA